MRICRRQFARRAAPRDRPAVAAAVRGVGRRPDPQLERRRLDHAAAARRRPIGALIGARPARWSSPTRPRSTCSRCSAPPRIAPAARAPRDRLGGGNFPHRSLHRRRGWPTRWAATSSTLRVDDIAGALGEDVAVLMLTQVNYRTGALHDMAAMTALVHGRRAGGVGPRHSAGALPVDLSAPMPTSRSAAATSTSTAARGAGLRLGASARSPGIASSGGNRCRAGSATPRRSRSGRTTSRRPASAASPAARRRCCR